MEFCEVVRLFIVCRVAPPAGAWIETGVSSCTRRRSDVAPPAGAWIETRYNHLYALTQVVAPPAGAWIETE